MKKLPMITLAMFFALGSAALAQGAGGGAGGGGAGGAAVVLVEGKGLQRQAAKAHRRCPLVRWLSQTGWSGR